MMSLNVLSLSNSLQDPDPTGDPVEPLLAKTMTTPVDALQNEEPTAQSPGCA